MEEEFEFALSYYYNNYLLISCMSSGYSCFVVLFCCCCCLVCFVVVVAWFVLLVGWLVCLFVPSYWLVLSVLTALSTVYLWSVYACLLLFRPFPFAPHKFLFSSSSSVPARETGVKRVGLMLLSCVGLAELPFTLLIDLLGRVPVFYCPRRKGGPKDWST